MQLFVNIDAVRLLDNCEVNNRLELKVIETRVLVIVVVLLPQVLSSSLDVKSLSFSYFLRNQSLITTLNFHSLFNCYW